MMPNCSAESNKSNNKCHTKLVKAELYVFRIKGQVNAISTQTYDKTKCFTKTNVNLVHNNLYVQIQTELAYKSDEIRYGRQGNGE